MKLEFLKTKKLTLISMSLVMVFLLILIYEIYFLYGLYQTLFASQSNTVLHQPQIVRFDFNAFNKATGYYNGANSFTSPAENIPDPFATKLPPGVDGNP